MISLNKKRGWAKACITRVHEYTKDLDDSITAELLSNKLKKLEESYVEFVEISKKLYDFADDEGFTDPVDDVLEYENKYFESHAILSSALKSKPQCSEISSKENAIDKLASQQATFLERLSVTNSDTGVHFTKIKVPSFSGNYQDWPSFRDLFLGAIDSKLGLSGTQKFHYLKSYLEGDALNLIKHIALTDSNYAEAWDRLVHRYERKSLIVRSFVHSFMSLPTCHSLNVLALRKISDGADEVIRGLNALKCNDRDPWLIYILLNKVDDETKKAWAEFSDSKTESKLEDFLSFLSNRCDAFESCQASSRVSTNRRSVVSNFAKPDERQFNIKCLQCQGQHTLAQCPSFKSLDINIRRSFVKSHNLCFNCLHRSHNVNKCPSTFRCRICHLKHHSLVHLEHTPLINSSEVPTVENAISNLPSTSAAAINNHSIATSTIVSQTFLPTILVQVADKWGKLVNCRVLLDSGSTVSFVTESFVQLVGLPRTNARIPVLGLSSSNAGVTRGRVSLKLISRTSNDNLNIEALVLSSLTSSIPTQSVDCTSSIWTQILKLPLADPSFGIAGPIDVLIGSDQLWNVYTGERLQFCETMPMALNTIFGWVIAGSFSLNEKLNPHVVTNHALLDIDSLIRSFIEIESIHTTDSKVKMADPAEVHFATTHTRDENGTYVVKYPFIEDAKPIDSTLPSTVNRLNSMERKFRKDPFVKEHYIQFMAEYLKLGHMELIPMHEVEVDKSSCFYLAHHAVFKLESSSTKCRVVFDGSCHDASGVSLNERLHVGPPIQRDLLGVCLRFRQHRFVFSTDIEKMFRGIKVSSDHTNFQRIIWRTDENSPIQHYRLLTVTYGLASSPFLAVRVLKQLADDYQQEFPNAARVLRNDAYVDDIATGSDSVEELLALKAELIHLLQKANFNLRKWSSNCWPLLESLPKEICEYNPVCIDAQSAEATVKILGLQWSPCNDELFLKISPISYSRIPTKRVMLSEISKIFDPLGIAAPTVILFKVLFQQSWFHGIGWDDELPENLCKQWCIYINDLPQLSKIRVPRHMSSQSGTIEIHGFADASSTAYAAVAYSRFKLNDKYVINLIASKTRVAPLKPISIPRLELNAAWLLTKLINLIKSSLTVNISNIFCWSDSEIVLHWLSSPPRRWNTFVCNRTAEILDITPRKCWQHVRSEDNPADCASRGLLPSILIKHELWWSGPSWLALKEANWPKTKCFNVSPSDSVVVAEEKSVKPIALCSIENINSVDILINKISSWSRLTRIIAYCIRFAKHCRVARFPSNEQHSPFLSAAEFQRAKTIILIREQEKSFKAEIQLLQQRKPLHRKSKLIRYTPFLDDDGVLRVGGRIKHANINYNIKFPILLPKTSPISMLIIRYVHNLNLHTGVEATFVIIRQQFWILGCRNLVRKVVFGCKRCFMQRRNNSVQLMGDLPSPRVQPNRAFLHCGLDYAGPVSIKMSKVRNAKVGKAWFAIFVCLSTKAIHIELVSDLTTEVFLAAFRRFIARRGKPTDMYSDNGTTFQGAKHTLDEFHKFAMSQTFNTEVAESLASDGITWHFIPPFAPHFGGLWEAGVRSIKLHLRRVIGSSILTFEEYNTILAQIESILNSRPLSPVSDTELDPLTPAHFLIGEPYTCIPEPSLLDQNINRLKHWRHLQAVVQGFWKRWHLDYITSLQHRNKWQHQGSNLEVGTIVVLKEPHLPPSKWILGRVKDVTVGDDGIVRVATVKTNKGEYKRPITKIAALPSC